MTRRDMFNYIKNEMFKRGAKFENNERIVLKNPIAYLSIQCPGEHYEYEIYLSCTSGFGTVGAESLINKTDGEYQWFWHELKRNFEIEKM